MGGVMNEQQLRDQLRQLAAALEALPVAAEQRESLQALIADIESQLGNTDADNSLVEQVETVVSAFEVEHPRIAGILNNIVATLGNMGV
jgi:uncharacterized protein YigA (DUF484 family)